MLLASIEVIPEFKTGVGDLDFLFLASVKGRGNCRFCAEFKQAHSNDIYRGLEIQLPAYMRSAGATYGAYCVLGFKGNWFDEPSAMSLSELEFDLQIRKLRLKDPLRENVRIFMYDLSKPATASTS
jgi:RNA-directed DNA polymerase